MAVSGKPPAPTETGPELCQSGATTTEYKGRSKDRFNICFVQHISSSAVSSPTLAHTLTFALFQIHHYRSSLHQDAYFIQVRSCDPAELRRSDLCFAWWTTSIWLIFLHCGQRPEHLQEFYCNLDRHQDERRPCVYNYVDLHCHQNETWTWLYGHED